MIQTKGAKTVKIRVLRPDEIELFNEMQSDAFLITLEEARQFMEHEYKNSPERTRALVDDQDNVKVVLELFLPQLWLGATSVPMLGYAGVASPAESRRRGYINQLIEGVWDEFYEQGYSIATLYPFYFPFYKKFGYEQVSYTRVVNLAIKELAKFKPSRNGEWVRVKEDQWEAFDDIYRQMCVGQFGRLVRTQTIWERKMRPWRGNPPRGYLWYDGQGQPQAYIIYVLKDGDKEREMYIRDMGWTTPELHQEVLAFIANHDSQAKKVIWISAPDDEIQALLDDPRECEEKLTPGYMLRFLDARRALEERSWPTEASGNFRLSVQDERIARNNVTLQVEFGGGKLQAQVVEDSNRAALSCHERQLAQMYAGHLSPVKLHGLGLLKSDDPQQLRAAQSLFSPPGQPASFMADFF
jgi:predicted acetyltransferase